MYGHGNSEEHQPLFWVRGYPLYGTHVIVAGFVASMLGTSLLLFLHADSLLASLPFTSTGMNQGEAWRIFTYGLVNPPSLWFAIEMLMIVWFGREVEKFLGRGTFFGLYAGLYLVPPILFTLIGRWQPTHLAGESSGFALFVAFATLFPNALMLFNLLAKWVALVLVALYSLIALSNRDGIGLLSLWSSAGFAYAFIRYQQGLFTLPRLPTLRRRPKLRVLPDLKPGRTTSVGGAKTSTMAEVDALLDKIAQSGYSSLTPKERARLDAARDELKRKESGGR